MDADPRLESLDLEVVTITRDGSGEVAVDGGGMTLEALVFLLRAAETIALHDWFYPEAEEDDGDDEV